MRGWVPLLALAIALSPLAVVHPVRVSGHSMEPTLKDGELRWALRAWASHAPRRGEIWVVAGPDGKVYLANGQVLIYGADGKRLGQIDVPERPLQLVFGGEDHRTLFILTHHALYAAHV